MKKKKKIAFFIDSLGGGGAERVTSVLCTELTKRGYAVDLVMLYDREIVYSLPDSVSVFTVDNMETNSLYAKLVRKLFDLWERIRFRFYIPLLRRLGCKSYAKHNETSFYFYAKYALPYREYLKRNPGCTAFGFLIRSNIALLMAARGCNVKTVFCERNNPIRPDMPKNIIKLRDRLYKSCSAAVFQTEEERDYYTKLRCEGVVIPNPIKDGLPEPFAGERRHEIVNFCRLNKQKNIPLLLEAFGRFVTELPDYTLRIYGRGDEKDSLEALARDMGLGEAVTFEDYTSDIHELIRDAAMFVSTSDYEGLSNSMLEAMAIGLPCVCTDCDGGGARMMIKDGENGLLVPKGDAEAVYAAMKRIAEEPELGKRLSANAVKLRGELSCERIADRWEAVI